MGVSEILGKILVNGWMGWSSFYFNIYCIPTSAWSVTLLLQEALAQPLTLSVIYMIPDKIVSRSQLESSCLQTKIARKSF